MKDFLKYFGLTLLITVIMFEGITIGLLTYPKGVFHSSYQSLIQDKYRILIETNEPKIIIVSGSSSAFGLNQKMLEDSTGYKVANLGLHAGFGHLFCSELAKANINEGDIVLLGYEYGWNDNGFENMDQSLIMSGIDDHVEMYTRIPIRKWPDFIGYLFKYAEMKFRYRDANGIFSREAFDSTTGQMTMVRGYNEDDYGTAAFGTMDIADPVITPEVEKYLKEFKAFVEKCGAEIYFISPPILAESIACDYVEFNKLKEMEEAQIGIPYISNPTDYFFPCELMVSDATYHCNTKGEMVRTSLLIADLKRAGIIQ